MPLVDPIPAPLDREVVLRRLRLDRRGGGGERLHSLLFELEELFRGRAYYREAFVESKTEDGVVIDGRSFRSRILRRNLDRAFKVYPYLVTAGPELETRAARLGDPLRRYDLEVLADAALESAVEGLRALLVRVSGLSELSSMSPGSLEDWPVTEQAPLFDLLGEGPARAGVRLLDSMMMVPRKSVSGLFFPSEETFVSCRLCSRASCPGRKAAFDPGAPVA